VIAKALAAPRSGLLGFLAGLYRRFLEGRQPVVAKGRTNGQGGLSPSEPQRERLNRIKEVMSVTCVHVLRRNTVDRRGFVGQEGFLTYTRLMQYFALTYDVVDNFAERRLPFRSSHLKMVQDAHERGDIVMAGALGDPPQKALIVFRATNAAVAERFAANDPYVTNGLVKSWSVEPWNVVIGGAA
jgi:uncharacterized protein